MQKVRTIWVGVKILPDGSEEFTALNMGGTEMPLVTSERDIGEIIFPQIVDELHQLTGEIVEIRRFEGSITAYRPGEKEETQ